MIIMNKTESCSMMHRHKKIIYGILIICMVFFGISVREIFSGMENVLHRNRGIRKKQLRHKSL